MRIIDPHLHFWHLEQGAYGWLRPENPPVWPDKVKLHRHFLPSDLVTEFDIAGVVHIEAGFDNDMPINEVNWVKQQCVLPLRVVAGIDLCLPSQLFAAQVSELASDPCVIGVRHILDDQAVNILSAAEVTKNLACLAHSGLHFELQMYIDDPEAVDCFVRIKQQVNALKVVVNHMGLSFRSAKQQQKHYGLHKLAEFSDVFIKASGWEMQNINDRQWREAEVANEVLGLLALFGDQRVMLASNFPLCALASSYQTLWHQYSRLPVSSSQLNRLVYQNARDIYQFD